MSTKWAGSDTVYNNFDVYYSFPAKLFEPVLVNDTINLNNYFAQYVYRFVKRYGPNGDFWQENPGLPYYPIKYYEMWNEPEWGIKDSACIMTCLASGGILLRLSILITIV
jgi:hypothetical protein